MSKFLVVLLAFFITSSAWSLELIDDQKYAEEALKAEQEADGSPMLMMDVAIKYANARDYQKSSDIIAKLISEYAVSSYIIYSNQSVFLGKQGRYEDAIAMADLALAMDPTAIHPKLVKASWLWESGHHEMATRLFDSVQVPESGSVAEPMYYGCRACFLATVGNIDDLKDAIHKCMELNNSHYREFIKRDIIFDKYRTQQWFIDLVGETVPK